MKFRIPVAEPSIGEEELTLVTEAVKSGWVSSKGRFIEEFERNFADYVGVKYAVATSNGTTALHLALTALEIGSRNDVIVPTLTFASVANAVIYTGAKPVFVDSHPVYWCVNPEEIENKITKKTKAIIPVHLYGHPCDMDTIVKIARDYDLYLVEDCAEAHGAEYKGKKVGSFGDIACFSFYGNKIITTGEGGICLTDNEELSERMVILRDHGMDPDRKYWHEVVGFNYRMTNLQAAIGVAQLEKINRFIEVKRENARLYNSLLEDVSGVTPPPEMEWAKNVYWMYSILVEDGFDLTRDELMRKMAKEGIETRPFFYPTHTMPPYEEGGEYPVSEALARKGMNLPSSVNLKAEEIEEVAEIIKHIHSSHR